MRRNIKFVDYLYSVKYYNNFTYLNKHIPEPLEGNILSLHSCIRDIFCIYTLIVNNKTVKMYNINIIYNFISILFGKIFSSVTED